MIRGIHGMYYSSEPEAARAFIRDKLQLPCRDVGGGWLIFDLQTADLGVHPVEEHSAAGTHYVSFFCDDMDGTVADLRARGVEFLDEIVDHGYGPTIHFEIPGGIRCELYEPGYK